MNITFFIGNGFDLNLGLKTKYKDFYNYYQEQESNSMILQSIKNDYELWSDLELGLGKFTQQMSKNDINGFLDEKAVLEYHLSRYLQKEIEKVKLNNSLSEKFKTQILNFYNDFNKDEIAYFKNMINNTNESIHYSFISFNYTDVLDQFVKSAMNINSFPKHICRSTEYTDRINMPLHVHGTLDSNLILGINDTSQIANEELRNLANLSDYIVKPKLNQELGERIIQNVKDVINNSRYICLFGLSIGDTDRYWWEYIAKWLLEADNHRLIIYVHNNTKIKLSGQETIRFRDSSRINFLNKVNGIKKDSKDRIKKQIIILPTSSTNLFKFNTTTIEIKDPLKKSL
ncbi:MAG: AbiH family protein [Hominimerdicola sp.]